MQQLVDALVRITVLTHGLVVAASAAGAVMMPADNAYAYLDPGTASILLLVRKSDPTVQRMLALREDIFEDYAEEAFVAALESHARIVRSQEVSRAGRKLFQYERH